MMTDLLFGEQPIVIDKEIALLVGLNESIVLQQVNFLIEESKKTNTNFFDGRYWVRCSLDTLQELYFSFWSIDTVKRTISRLVSSGLLIVNNFNKDPLDRSKWYSINYKNVDALGGSTGFIGRDERE